jgi:hypothetical protein
MPAAEDKAYHNHRVRFWEDSGLSRFAFIARAAWRDRTALAAMNIQTSKMDIA